MRLGSLFSCLRTTDRAATIPDRIILSGALDALVFAINALVVFGTLPCHAGDESKWVTIKGQIVWDAARKPVTKQLAIQATKDAVVCAKDKDFKTEDWVVDPKSGGIKNVVVWVTPEPTDPIEIKAIQKARANNKRPTFKSFKSTDIHPTLKSLSKKAIEIDQPCCRFIPHVLAARAGQEMVIKNSAPIPHNAKWTSHENGEFNQLIPAGGKYKLANALVAEKYTIKVECSIHSWMSALRLGFRSSLLFGNGRRWQIPNQECPGIEGHITAIHLARERHARRQRGPLRTENQSEGLGRLDLGAIKFKIAK